MDRFDGLRDRLEEVVGRTRLRMKDIFKDIGVSRTTFYKFVNGGSIDRLMLMKIEDWVKQREKEIKLEN